MKKAKKIVILMLIMLLSVSVYGCGSNDSDKNSNNNKNSDQLVVSVAEGYVDFIKEIKADFEKENGVKVKVEERDMFEQLEALALDGPAGLAPDVMMSAYDRIGSLGRQGHLAEVDFKNDELFEEKDVNQVSIDGKTYGIPTVIETLVFYYNKDLITDVPKTFLELEELSKDAKYNFPTEAGKNTAFLAKWTDFYFSYGLISGYDGYVFGKDGTDPKDIGLNSKGAVEGITYATKWFQDVWPKGMQDVKSADDFIQDQFIKGNTAAIIGGPWSSAKYKEAKLNYGVAKLPTLPNGKEYSAFGGGKGWVINNYSKKKDIAKKWIEYTTSTDIMKKFFDATNEIPANLEARKYVVEQNDELSTAVIDQYANAQPMPNIPEMSEVWTGAENLMFDAVSGKKTPQESADEAVKFISEAITQKHSK